jgi:gamma-carbonic anhydrase
MAGIAAGAVILPYKGIRPTLAPDVYVAPTAAVIGDVHVGAGSSIWFGAVLRGDVHRIRVGEGSNIQDGAVCHVTTDKWPLVIGHRVTVGHRAVLHGCTVGDGALVGMGATVLDGALLEPRSMVAAGALVAPGKVVPTGWLWAGVPARPMRALTDAELAYLSWSGPHYREVAGHYRSAV